MEAILGTLSADRAVLAAEYVGFSRIALPVLAAFLLIRCVMPLLTFRREPEIWA